MTRETPETGIVRIKTEYDTFVHISARIAGYATLCGVSDDDDEESGRQVPLAGAKCVTCPECFYIWQVATQFSRKDFRV